MDEKSKLLENQSDVWCDAVTACLKKIAELSCCDTFTLETAKEIRILANSAAKLCKGGKSYESDRAIRNQIGSRQAQGIGNKKELPWELLSQSSVPVCYLSSI